MSADKNIVVLRSETNNGSDVYDRLLCARRRIMVAMSTTGYAHAENVQW